MTRSDHVDTNGVQAADGNRSSQPVLHQYGLELQPFGTLRLLPIALAHEARLESCQLLNHILADTFILQSQVPAMLSRLLEAHEMIIAKVRHAVTRTAANDDSGTNDLLVSDVLRRHELQVWFLAEHLVDTPAVRV